MSRTALAIFLGCCASGLACASTSTPRVADPVRTKTTLSRVLRAGDGDALYALLHPELRQTLPPEAFRERFALCRAETAEVGRELDTASDVHARATVHLASGEPITLVLEHGAWRIASGVFDSTSLATPQEAVVELRNAWARRNLPGLLRLLARERRAELVATLEAMLEGSADLANLQVVIEGEEARVRLSGGAGEIVLRKEAGKWRLWDLQ
jgi:hypothetical protein